MKTVSIFLLAIYFALLGVFVIIGAVPKERAYLADLKPRETTVLLSDGRSVVCLGLRDVGLGLASLSCDWEHAK